MTQLRTFALKVPEKSQASSSISSLEETSSLEDEQVDDKTTDDNATESSSQAESESVSSSQEVEEESGSESDLEEIEPFAVASGFATQEDPYIIDITDAATTPSAGYTVSSVGASKYTFTLSEAGAYYTVTGGSDSTPSANSIIVAANNITISLSNTHIRVSDASRAALNTQNYNVTLNLLEGTTNSFENNRSTSSSDTFAAGILHTPDKGNLEVSGELRIQGKGSLSVAGGYNAAGIGSGATASGIVVIAEDATVTVVGGRYSAGIGGGYRGSNGTVKVMDNATVTSTSGMFGAGIGGGYGGNGGTIEISTSGVVTSSSEKNGAGIGGGHKGNAGDISISGSGVVKATGGIGYLNSYSGGAGIGTGGNDNSTPLTIPVGNIKITSGTVFATGGARALGIGYAQWVNTSGTSVGIISGGNVYVTGNYPDGQMQMTNGQSDNAEVFRNLLTVQDLTTSKEITSVTAEGAEWYQVNNSETFTLSSDPGKQLISVWIPKTSTDKTIFAELDGVKYRAYYTRDNSVVSDTTEETLYKKIDVTVNDVIGGGGYISEINNTSFSVNSSAPTVYPNDTVEISANPSPGYDFVSWEAQGISISDSDKSSSSFSFLASTNDVVFTPSFKLKDYSITYATNGGTNDSSNPNFYTYTVGVSSFAEPIKTGYSFENWYDDADFTNVVTNISNTSLGNVTLYAKWEVNHYTVTYNLDNGTNNSKNPNEYTYGIGVSTLEEPSKVGYTFAGWYSDPDFSSKVADISKTDIGNVTLYAKWEANHYNITYNLNGGKDNSNPNSYVYGIGITDLGSPEREGYTFDNWYTDANFKNVVTDISNTSLGDITLYARWSPKLYTLTYLLMI